MPITAVIDTNLLISALIGQKTRAYFEKITTAYTEEKVQIYYCDTLVSEFWEVASRPYFRRYFSLHQSLTFIRAFLGICEEAKVTTSTATSRDPKDNFLLSLCSTVQADYLVSGDKDLLVLVLYENTQIVALGNFISILEDL